MVAPSKQLERQAIGIGWRHWAALGISADRTRERDNDTVIDPEALILFTAALGDADPRLRDESSDWCVKYGARLISGSRLKNLASGFPSSDRIDEYVATINANSPTRWHLHSADAAPREFEPSAKSRLPPLRKSPRLLRLHLRALFGTTARAEVLLGFLTAPPPRTFLSASQFAYSAYSKRNVSMVLDDFALSEVLSQRRIRNRIGFRLESVSELVQLFPSARTARFVRWDVRLRLVANLLELAARIERKTEPVRGIEAAKFVAGNAADLATLELSPPDADDASTYWESFLDWATTNVVTADMD